jgi:hypothetical protein
MEVLNISDTADMKLEGWWNPYNCPGNNWFTSPVHANEIHYNKSCGQVFLSTGKSDMMVIDVTDPSNPDSCNYYGGVSNGMGTWGAGLYDNQVYLSYICAVIPFISGWTGVKILQFDPCSSFVTGDRDNIPQVSVFPNPCTNRINIEFRAPVKTGCFMEIIDIRGKIVFQRTFSSSNASFGLDLKEGLYFYKAGDRDKTLINGKLILMKP